MLTDIEGRVLGSLIEKALATPQSYPLSESALLAACNQTTNREPVVDYSQTDVRRALIGLREEGLARTARRPGERTEKHLHLADSALALSPAGLALLGVLLLRGPQTAGELRTRTERLHGFEDADAVEAALEALADREGGALVRRLERQPGQKEPRWVQLLAAEGEAAGVRGSDAAAGPTGGQPEAADAARTPLDALRAEVAELRAQITALEARLSAVEG